MNPTLPTEERATLAASLEAILDGYLHYALQIGMSEQEVMKHYENTRLLIASLQTSNKSLLNSEADGNHPHQRAA